MILQNNQKSDSKKTLYNNKDCCNRFKKQIKKIK